MLLFARPAWCADNDEHKLSDEEVLAQTQGRIREYRQGNGLVIVRNPKGKPVRNARVTVEQLRHDFRFGSNFFMFDHCGSPDREAQYRDRFTALLNYCTLGFYWAGFEPERGKPNYGYIDQVAEWTRAHGITCKGHPLVWDHPAGSPAWLPDLPEQIEPLSHARVHDIVSRYRGRIDIWDVVNEPTHLDKRVNKSKVATWADTLGPVPYVAQHLKIARRANPNALLLVNDYRTEPAYYDILQDLRADGRFLFDVVGLQSHMHNSVWSLQRVWTTCDRFAKLGLPLHFTEMTIVSGPRKGPGENWAPTTAEGEAEQARHAANIYTALFAHPAVQAITWWDFTDLSAWQGAAAGWLRQDMSPKPVYQQLHSLIKGEWWTKIEGRTDHDGKWRARAFYGHHRIKVERPDGQVETREVQWQRNLPNQFEFGI
jgi:GH35 family endo-1,4-beta-xylanase